MENEGTLNTCIIEQMDAGPLNPTCSRMKTNPNEFHHPQMQGYSSMLWAGQEPRLASLSTASQSVAVCSSYQVDKDAVSGCEPVLGTPAIRICLFPADSRDHQQKIPERLRSRRLTTHRCFRSLALFWCIGTSGGGYSTTDRPRHDALISQIYTKIGGYSSYNVP